MPVRKRDIFRVSDRALSVAVINNTKCGSRDDASSVTRFLRCALAVCPHRRRKEEAEEKRSKAKKARMGFMKMLAQNTQIDGRSRWDDAERTLRDDARFKAVPDSSDREDLFNEFVEALTKKEKVCAVCFIG